jgi:urease accessory protein
MDASWLVLQLADSGFPAGGFAHSAGLEAAVQHGHVRTRDDVVAFARAFAWQTGCGALPLVRAAHDAPEEWSALDARADAFLAQHVAQRASALQGKAFLETCARVFPVETGPLRARAASLKLHHAPVFGVVLRALGVPLTSTLEVHLSLAVRGVLSAATRLGVIGTHDSQRVQTALRPLLDDVMRACVTQTSVVQTAPVLDLLQSTHDRLYSRLFLS